MNRKKVDTGGHENKPQHSAYSLAPQSWNFHLPTNARNKFLLFEPPASDILL